MPAANVTWASLPRAYLRASLAYHEGGYETKTNPFTEQVEDDITGNVLAYLQGHAR
jgi:hypothetical protein